MEAHTHRRAHALLWLGAVIVALASVPSGAVADVDGDKRKASALLDEGNGHFTARRYREARQRYEAAYAAYASPKILLNLAEASRELGELDRAVEHYERFLAEASAEVQSKHAAQVSQRLEELRPRLGRLRVSGPAGAEVAVDGRARGRLPLGLLWALPGKREVVVGEATRAVTVRAGATEAVELGAATGAVVAAAEPSAPPSLTPEIPRGPAADAEPTTLVAASPPDEDEGSGGVLTRWWFWTGVGVLAASAVVVGVAAGGADSGPALGGELGRVSTAGWTTFDPRGGR